MRCDLAVKKADALGAAPGFIAGISETPGLAGNSHFHTIVAGNVFILIVNSRPRLDASGTGRVPWLSSVGSGALGDLPAQVVVPAILD